MCMTRESLHVPVKYTIGVDPIGLLGNRLIFNIYKMGGMRVVCKFSASEQYKYSEVFSTKTSRTVVGTVHLIKK